MMSRGGLLSCSETASSQGQLSRMLRGSVRSLKMATLSESKDLCAHFDCFGGATVGAMLAACLHDSDSDRHQLVTDIETSIQTDYPTFHLKHLQVRKSTAGSMIGTAVNVILKEASDVEMSLQQVLETLDAVTCDYVPTSVYEKAKKVFQELSMAHKVVHGRSPSDVHVPIVHVVEVVATLLAFHKLHVGTVSCGPLPLGDGSCWSGRDGLLPIPSPVTLQLLIGMKTCPSSCPTLDVDLVTPTAVALLRVLTNTSSLTSGHNKRPSSLTIQIVGVGMDKEGAESRVVRLVLGESNVVEATSPLPDLRAATDRTIERRETNQSFKNDTRWKMDQLTQLEANLDDMTAEALAFAVQILLDNGAADAWVVPIIMKKGRAAHTLCCLCHSDDSIVSKLLELMFRHSTTLGIRILANMERVALRRKFLSIQTSFDESSVAVKVGYLGEEVVSIKAEFEDCARISLATNVPIKAVADNAVQQANRKLHQIE